MKDRIGYAEGRRWKYLGFELLHCKTAQAKVAQFPCLENHDAIFVFRVFNEASPFTEGTGKHAEQQTYTLCRKDAIFVACYFRTIDHKKQLSIIRCCKTSRSRGLNL